MLGVGGRGWGNCFALTSQSHRSPNGSFEGSVSKYRLYAFLCGSNLILSYEESRYGSKAKWAGGDQRSSNWMKHRRGSEAAVQILEAEENEISQGLQQVSKDTVLERHNSVSGSMERLKSGFYIRCDCRWGVYFLSSCFSLVVHWPVQSNHTVIKPTINKYDAYNEDKSASENNSRCRMYSPQFLLFILSSLMFVCVLGLQPRFPTVVLQEAAQGGALAGMSLLCPAHISSDVWSELRNQCVSDLPRHNAA